MSAPVAPLGSSHSASSNAGPFPSSNNPRDDLPTDNPSPEFPIPAIHAAPDLPVTMSISFQLAPRAAAAAASSLTAFRRGTLTLERTSASQPPLRTRLASPGLFLYSRRLLIPHLTPDTLHDLALPTSGQADQAGTASPPVVDLTAEQIVANLPANYPATLRQFANLHGQFSLFSLRDPALPAAVAQVDNKAVVHGPDFVHARTHRGLTKITASNWATLLQKWMPDMAQVPAQVYMSGAVVGKKAAERSVVRSLAYLDTVVAQAPKEVPLWATVAGFRPVDLVQAAQGIAKRAASHNTSVDGAVIAGVVVDAPTVADLNPVAPHLPQDLVRYAPSVMTPETMVRHLGTVDFFPSTLAFVLSSAGYSLNLSLERLNDEGNGIQYLMDRAAFAKDYKPLGGEHDHCLCWACQNHNRAYVYHLLDCHEMLGWTLLTIHNLHQLSTFFASIRTSLDTEPAHVTQAKLDAWLAYYTEHVVPEQTRILDANGLPEHAATLKAQEVQAEQPAKVKKDKKRPRSAAFEQNKDDGSHVVEGDEGSEEPAAKRVRRVESVVGEKR